MATPPEPEYVRAVIDSGSQITVEWDYTPTWFAFDGDDSSLGGFGEGRFYNDSAVDQFTVEMSEDGSAFENAKTVAYSDGTTSYSVSYSSLNTSDYSYVFRVRAENVDGNTVWSKTVYPQPSVATTSGLGVGSAVASSTSPSGVADALSTDLSGDGHSSSVAGEFALEFNDGDDSASAPNEKIIEAYNDNRELTISVTLSIDKVNKPNSSNWETFLSLAGSSHGSVRFERDNQRADQVRWTGATTNSNTNYQMAEFGDLEHGEFYTLTMVVDYANSGESYSYKNGELVGTHGSPGGLVDWDPRDWSFNFRGWADMSFAGITVWDHALTQSEIQSHANGDVPRNGLVGHWPLNEGSGTTVHDMSGYGNHGTIDGSPKWYSVGESADVSPHSGSITTDSTAGAMLELVSGSTFGSSHTSSPASGEVIRGIGVGASGTADASSVAENLDEQFEATTHNSTPTTLAESAATAPLVDALDLISTPTTSSMVSASRGVGYASDKRPSIDTKSTTVGETSSEVFVDETSVPLAESSSASETQSAAFDDRGAVSEALTEVRVAQEIASATSSSANGFAESLSNALRASSSATVLGAVGDSVAVAVGETEVPSVTGVQATTTVEVVAYVSSKTAQSASQSASILSETHVSALAENAAYTPVSPSLGLVIGVEKGEIGLESAFADSLAASVGAATNITVAKTVGRSNTLESSPITHTTTEMVDELELNGSDEEMSVPDMGLGGNQTVSIAARFKVDPNTNSGSNNIFGFGNSGNSDSVCSIRTRGDGGYRFYFWGNDLDASTESYYGEWTHVVATYDASTSTRKIYHNGTEVASDSPSSPNFDDTTYILGGFNDEYFDGIIDNVEVYNQPITSSEAGSLSDGSGIAKDPLAKWDFTEGVGDVVRDVTGNGYDGVLQNSPNWRTKRELIAGSSFIGSSTTSAISESFTTLALLEGISGDYSASEVIGAITSLNTITSGESSSSTVTEGTTPDAVADALDGLPETATTVDALREAADASMRSGVVDTDVEAAAIAASAVGDYDVGEPNTSAGSVGFTESFSLDSETSQPTSETMISVISTLAETDSDGDAFSEVDVFGENTQYSSDSLDSDVRTLANVAAVTALVSMSREEASATTSVIGDALSELASGESNVGDLFTEVTGGTITTDAFGDDSEAAGESSVAADALEALSESDGSVGTGDTETGAGGLTEDAITQGFGATETFSAAEALAAVVSGEMTPTKALLRRLFASLTGKNTVEVRSGQSVRLKNRKNEVEIL